MRHLAQASDAQLRIAESILAVVVMDSGLVAGACHHYANAVALAGARIRAPRWRCSPE
jgi:hypothetical protein